MAKREEQPRFERPEDLGEASPELGTNAASSGAGARETSENQPADHERVNMSDVRQGIPNAEGVMGDPHSSFSADDTVDEETENAFREAVEEMYNEGEESAGT